MSKRQDMGRVRDAVFDYVRRRPGRRGVDIAKDTEINWASVRTALYRLHDAGKLKRREDKRWETAA
jgi:DNA-binding transcriptional regulator PaaX